LLDGGSPEQLQYDYDDFQYGLNENSHEQVHTTAYYAAIVLDHVALVIEAMCHLRLHVQLKRVSTLIIHATERQYQLALHLLHCKLLS
jgi:hypothetical protein